MDYRTTCGRVRAGRYRNLWLAGECEIGDDVTFDTCTVFGSVVMSRCVGGRLICRSASIECAGDMRVGTVEGHGCLTIHSDLRCDRLSFVGVTDVGESLTCVHTMSVYGRLVNRRTVTAGAFRLWGTIQARDVRVQSLSIRPVRGMMLASNGIRDYSAGSRVRTVVGGTVEVAGVECETLHARVASLSGYCSVTQLCSSRGGYVSDGTSRIVRYDADCDGAHLGPCPA